MDKLLQEALSFYSFKNPKIMFLRHNENITYKIEDIKKQYVLRIHKPVDGFSLGILSNEGEKKEYIQSEMLLLDYLQKNIDFQLQKPVRNNKELLVSILTDKTPVTVLEWVHGMTLSDTEITCETAQKIGLMVAKLHRASKTVKINNNGNLCLLEMNCKAKRYQYKQQILDKINKELKVAESNDHINSRHINIVLDATAIMQKRMDELSEIPNMLGIVHADLSLSNMILTADNRISPIDFSLSGVGFYYMDIGTMLSVINDKDLRRCVKNAYEKEMKIEVPICYIEAFFALAVILFITCQHNKFYKEEWFETAMERWCNTIFTPLINGKTFVL